MLKILGKSPSINVRKVLWACHELGLDYEQEQFGSGFQSTQTAEFKALNPNAMVPVVLDGEFVLWESNVICRYLAAREGREDLLSSDPKRRALTEQWMDWQAGEQDQIPAVRPFWPANGPPNCLLPVPKPLQNGPTAAKAATVDFRRTGPAAGLLPTPRGHWCRQCQMS